MNDDQKAQAAELHDQGFGRNAIALQLGVGQATISRWAANEGREFDREQTAAAVRVAVVSRSSRRQGVTDRLYSRLEAVVDRMEYRPEGGWMTLMRDAKGGERMVPVDELPIRDLKDLAQTVNSLVYSIAALERSNALFAQEEGMQQTKDMLTSLAEAMGINTFPAS